MKHMIPTTILTFVASMAVAQGVESPDSPLATAARLNAQLGVAYLEKNDVPTAQLKIDRALVENPKDPEVQTAAGLLYERLQEVDKADRAYSAAVRLEPRNAQRQNNYAVFQCRRGKYVEGQKLFEEAARNPAYSTPEVAYANAGVCARSANDLPRAEAQFRKALSLRPDFPDALLQMTDLSFTRGAHLEARAFLERYFNVAPATAEALLLGVRIERKLGDQGAADHYAGQLRRDFPNSEQMRKLVSDSSGG
jgi:type IV pilus assembly protein PilF